jgi:zinc transporter, ZIP family
MSTPQILLLGAIAGLTIFLGLPVGRMRGLSANTRTGLSALATGILVFLFWDVMSNAVEPIDSALHASNWSRVVGLSVLGIAGFVAGLMSLVYYDAWMKARASRRSSPLVGPGAAAVDEFDELSERARRRGPDLTNPAIRLSFLIAVGIGVHNFGEGLAIGQAAAASEIALAVTLIIGFGLHNATEGFGICGPLSGAGIVPSWRLLGLLGLIGGAPTFLGTVVGQAWTSDAVSVVFFTIAGGSILYVVQELFAVNRKYGNPVLVMWLVLVGVLLGFATDFVVTAAGV